MEIEKASALDVKTEKAAVDVKAYSNGAVVVPAVDVKGYSNGVVVEVDMPGMKSGDIKVEVDKEDNVLTVIGKRKREDEEEGAVAKCKYLVRERGVGKLMRKFRMHKNANTDSISALYHQGVLTITIPNLPPRPPPKPMTIEVKFA